MIARNRSGLAVRPRGENDGDRPAGPSASVRTEVPLEEYGYMPMYVETRSQEKSIEAGVWQTGKATKCGIQSHMDRR